MSTWTLVIILLITAFPDYRAELIVRGIPSSWSCNAAAVTMRGLNGTLVTVQQSECIEITTDEPEGD